MRPLKLIFVALILLIGFTESYCRAEVESTIGKFSFAGPTLTEPEIISQFGQGFVKRENENTEKVQKHIYYLSEENLWIELSFSHVLDEKMRRSLDTIMLTKEKICDKKFKPKETFGSLITSKGIKIGDSLTNVIQKYGTPSVSSEIGKDGYFSVLQEELKLTDGKVLRYLGGDDDLLSSEFYFKDGQLHSILISISE